MKLKYLGGRINKMDKCLAREKEKEGRKEGREG